MNNFIQLQRLEIYSWIYRPKNWFWAQLIISGHHFSTTCLGQHTKYHTKLWRLLLIIMNKNINESIKNAQSYAKKVRREWKWNPKYHPSAYCRQLNASWSNCDRTYVNVLKLFSGSHMSLKLNNKSTMIIMYDYDDLHLIIRSIQFANKLKSLTSI